MKVLQLAGVLIAITVGVAFTIAYPFLEGAALRVGGDKASLDPLQAGEQVKTITFAVSPPAEQQDAAAAVSPPTEQQDQAAADLLPSKQQDKVAIEVPLQQQAMAEQQDVTAAIPPADATPTKTDLSYLAYYAYSEVPPDTKPADTVLDSLKDVPIGTPVEEIKRASEAFGLDFTFMKAVAKIESGFDPKQRTGSYIGLFQLSNYEFDMYGSGDITNPRDNAIAAAYKFTTAAIRFELESHQKATLSDLYLIHQQGTQGAAEHVSHPERIAWKSMCATDEGRMKGEKWCKRAIWQNTLPAIKQIWKTVDNLTSGAFVTMWQQRVAALYLRYSESAPAQ